jgi:hypothetical protein
MGQVRQELDALTEAERFRIRAIGRAEVTDEPGDNVRWPTRKRGQERLRVPAPEEIAGVRDPQPVAGRVEKAGEIVEVGAVPDDFEAGSGHERTHLLGDGPRGADDGIGVPAHEARERTFAAKVMAPVRVRGERVAQVGHPAGSGEPLRRRPGQVHRPGWRSGEDDVDSLAADNPCRRRGRRQLPEDARVGHESAAEKEPGAKLTLAAPS